MKFLLEQLIKITNEEEEQPSTESLSNVLNLIYLLQANLDCASAL